MTLLVINQRILRITFSSIHIERVLLKKNRNTRKNFVTCQELLSGFAFMSDLRCCFPLFRPTFIKKRTSESSISSAASESALNDSKYDKLFADQNFLSSTLVQAGSVHDCVSLRDSITDNNPIDARPGVLNTGDTQVFCNRELVTRERLVDEILRLRRALEVTDQELKKTEDCLRNALMDLAKERESATHRGLFRSLLNPLRHRKPLVPTCKINRSGSCPQATLQLPPQSGLSSSSDPYLFSDIHFIVDPVTGS